MSVLTIKILISLNKNDRARRYAKSITNCTGHILANTRPRQLHLGDWEMVTGRWGLGDLIRRQMMSVYTSISTSKKWLISISQNLHMHGHLVISSN